MTGLRRGAPRTVLPGYLRLDQIRVLGLPAAAWRIGILLLALLGIELYARYILATPYELVPVTTMANRAFELGTDPAFLRENLAWTALTVGVSFAAAAVLGVVTAYAMHRFRWCDRALQPYVSIFYAVPTFAMYPLLVVLFGTGLAPIIVISTAFSTVVVVARARVGFASVSASAAKLSASLRLGGLQYVRLVLVPAALPDIVSGLKLALSYAITAVLATEFILSTRGVGYFISRAYSGFNAVDMYGGIFLVSVVALAVVLVVDRLSGVLDWRQR